MEWVNLIDNAVDKLKKDGRDADASEFLDLKAFLEEHPENLSALMHIIGYELTDMPEDDCEVCSLISSRL